MSEAELFEQPSGAVIPCVGVGCDPCELLIDGEGLAEYSSYCFSSEAETPMVLVNSVAKEGDPVPGAEDQADQTNDVTRTCDRPDGLVLPITKEHLRYDACRLPF
jgi:hypothetical protein